MTQHDREELGQLDKFVARLPTQRSAGEADFERLMADYEFAMPCEPESSDRSVSELEPQS